MMNLGVFYKMADLKDNFREWLIQQGTKPGTITSYLSRLQKISHQNWDMLTINIIPLLVRYYELANKEYYLDRVTILQALEYFNTISDNIYETTKSDIKLDNELFSKIQIPLKILETLKKNVQKNMEEET